MNNMKPEGVCDVRMSMMAKRAPRRVCGYVISVKLSVNESLNPLPKTQHVDALAAPPWQLDFASPRLTCNHRVRHGDKRKTWSDAIRASMSLHNHLSIFARGSKSNWNHNDNLQPTAGIAVLSTTEDTKPPTALAPSEPRQPTSTWISVPSR